MILLCISISFGFECIHDKIRATHDRLPTSFIDEQEYGELNHLTRRRVEQSSARARIRLYIDTTYLVTSPHSVRAND
jgi:hypothetical protein